MDVKNRKVLCLPVLNKGTDTMKLPHIIKFLENIAPPELADESDIGRIGLILDRKNEVNHIATSLDVTEHVLLEAAQSGADLLVAHHTPIYEPVNRLSKTLADTLKIALDNEISIYVMHTNYDRAQGGINDVLAGLLGLHHTRTIDMGRIGDNDPTNTEGLARLTAQRLDTHVQYAGDHMVESVMVLGGSGFRREYIEMAIDAGADALVSGELRHDVIPYSKDISLIDATHYATENPAMRTLAGRLPVESVFIDSKPQVRVIVQQNSSGSHDLPDLPDS
ncbi:MAG: Nif3-like dinuclear metal center hexameric protein [ANME-2 cluster archaeon]|nr:Nif3-like dinuclear metal center hexameric protein [ANME-2 cluster archaeon]